jgi:glycosyltransferase involved in cell wall biosynthesis
MKHKKELVWYGPPFSYSGYALHNRALITAMSKLGWRIRLIPTEEHIPDDLINKGFLVSLTDNKDIDPKENVVINLVPPPALPCYGKYTVLYTTIESKTVHYGFLNRCSLFDEVWVPCFMNVSSLLFAGVRPNRLFRVPEGVDSDFWKDTVTPNPEYKKPQFTFFYNGDWSFRKGIDVLIRAYASAFSDTDPVRLLLLVHYQGNGEQLSRERIPMEVRDICRQYSIKSLPPTDFIFKFIDDTVLPSIYACADCYVAPTRGEAWGLPIIQAMSCGLPAIVPNYGGHMDYCNKHTCHLTKLDGFDIFDDKVNLTVDFYRNQLFPFPNVQSFADSMRFAFVHREDTLIRGARARAHVRDNFSWEQAAAIMDRRLTAIYEDRRNFSDL